MYVHVAGQRIFLMSLVHFELVPHTMCIGHHRISQTFKIFLTCPGPRKCYVTVIHSFSIMQMLGETGRVLKVFENGDLKIKFPMRQIWTICAEAVTKVCVCQWSVGGS